MPRSTMESGWTARTVATAFGISLTALAITAILSKFGAWLDVPWSELLVAALSGTLYLAWRHPRNKGLSFGIFLPVCLFALIVFGPIVLVPLERLFE
jgi:hypothetical protein